MFWEMLGTEAAAQKPTRSITDNAKLQGLEKTCDEARVRRTTFVVPPPHSLWALQLIRLTMADSS